VAENLKLGVEALPCICCGKQLRPAFLAEDLITNQPSKGLCFETQGHYGSTVFDMCAGYLEISVCDACILDKAKEGRVAHIRVRQPRPEITSVLLFDPDKTEGSPDE
jgi:hypothetical protein